MSQPELLKRVTQTLEDAQIEYMVTGSVASSLYGEPRSTHDIDLVVAIKETDVSQLIKAFRLPRFYLDEQSMIQAIEKKDMFNLIDTKEGDKVDFWILTNDAFDQSRFLHRKKQKFMGFHMQVASPEDMILVKLKWAKLAGGSEKQFTDALRIYEVQSKGLDINYLEEWVQKLDLKPLWENLKARSVVA